MANQHPSAKQSARQRQNHVLRNFRSQCKSLAPRTFEEFQRFAAENTTGFVAFDFDSWRQKPGDVTELGFAFVPPPSELLLLSSPSTQSVDLSALGAERREPNIRRRVLDEVARAGILESHSIRVKGRKRGECDRESYWYTPLQLVEPGAVEAEALKLLRGFQKKNKGEESLSSGGGAASGPLVLVGFSIEYELGVLLRTYPRLIAECPVVIDLQEVVMDLCGMTQRPPLRNTLIACGLKCMTRANSRKALCAGNDAVRVALLLVNMLKLPSSPQPSLAAIGPRRNKKPYNWYLNKELRARKYWYKHSPRPKELYPYTVAVTEKDACCRDKIPFADPESLFAFFEGHNPIASGVRRNQPRGPIKCGYLSFASLESHDTFIAKVHGKTIGGRVWSVGSKYDPDVQPACSLEEHRYNRREGNIAQTETRQQQRQKRRQDFANAVEEDVGSFINNMFAL
ncbi:Ribonuclease H [Apiospora arundinis]|uniref:Ribonuclease H n=1 Tax=Apiospora arundinis TaxID=335852 RepID=A0ABR2J498_9PEZI